MCHEIESRSGCLWAKGRLHDLSGKLQRLEMLLYKCEKSGCQQCSFIREALDEISTLITDMQHEALGGM